jgi:hypothetical protein
MNLYGHRLIDCLIDEIYSNSPNIKTNPNQTDNKSRQILKTILLGDGQKTLAEEAAQLNLSEASYIKLYEVAYEKLMAKAKNLPRFIEIINRNSIINHGREKFLQTKIEDFTDEELGFGATRMKSFFRKAEIMNKTAQILTEFSKSDLQKFENCGAITIFRIEQFLQKNGCNLKRDKN